MTEEGLKKIEISVSKKVLIIGGGFIAHTAARHMLGMGYDVLLTFPGDQAGKADDAPRFLDGHTLSIAWEHSEALKQTDNLEIIAPARIVEFHGVPGRFRVHFRTGDNRSVETEVGAVILAAGAALKPAFRSWGLRESQGVLSLSKLTSALKSKGPGFFRDDNKLRTVVFLSGFHHPSYPSSQKRAIDAAIQLASRANTRVLFLTEHFKVADMGMERLMRTAREAGVLFVKMAEARPNVVSRSGAVAISFYDETLGEDISVNPEIVVVEESYEPHDNTANLAGTLGIHLDSNGFFQGDNVYNLPIFTNRTGIWVVGSAKGPVSIQEALREAEAAVLGVHQLLGQGARWVAENRIQLDRKKCTICLTCYRLCPHRAISYVDRRPVFSDVACRACGLCAAECPMTAIQLHGFTDAELKSEIERQDDKTVTAEKRDEVRLVAFCCQNSAFESMRLASLRGTTLPEGLRVIKVPCAAMVDAGVVLNAFRFGAQGVMVLACHHESCKSVNGSEIARWRIDDIYECLEELGLERGRLLFSTLGPGAATEFTRLVLEMELKALDIGRPPGSVFMES